MTSLGSRTLLGTSGDISDFQYLSKILHQYHVTEVCYNDGHLMSPKQWYTALAAVLYKRRSESNPLWTANVLAGVEDDGSIFLGSCDLLGTQFQADSIATGYGAHFAQPLLRDATEMAQARNSPLTEQEAFNVIEKCMKVLYYRDARSIDKVKKITHTKIILFNCFRFKLLKSLKTASSFQNLTLSNPIGQSPKTSFNCKISSKSKIKVLSIKTETLEWKSFPCP